MSFTAVALSPDSSAALMRPRVCALRRAISSAEPIACAMSGSWFIEYFRNLLVLSLSVNSCRLSPTCVKTHTHLTATASLCRRQSDRLGTYNCLPPTHSGACHDLIRFG